MYVEMSKVGDTEIKTRADTTLDLMREIFRGVAEQRSEAWLHTDLSMAQVKALVVIGKGAEPSVGDVAKELGIGLSAASQIVDRLVKADLVERQPHPHDRRVTRCVLTGTGNAALRQLQTAPRLVREWLERLSPEDLASLERGLGALARQARKSRQ